MATNSLASSEVDEGQHALEEIVVSPPWRFAGQLDPLTREWHGYGQREDSVRQQKVYGRWTEGSLVGPCVVVERMEEEASGGVRRRMLCGVLEDGQAQGVGVEIIDVEGPDGTGDRDQPSTCFFGEWSQGKKHGTGSEGKLGIRVLDLLSARDFEADMMDRYQPETLAEYVKDEVVFSTEWKYHEPEDMVVLERAKKVWVDAILTARTALPIAERLIADEQMRKLLAQSKQIREDIAETREFKDSDRLDTLFKSTVFLQRWWRKVRTWKKLQVENDVKAEQDVGLEPNRSDSRSDSDDESVMQEQATEVEKLVALFQASDEQEVAWPSVVSPAMRTAMSTTSQSYQKMIEECGIADPAPSLSLLDELLDDVCLEMMQSPRDEKLNPLHVYCMNPSITLKGLIRILSHPSAHVMVIIKSRFRWNRIPLHDLCGNNCASNKMIEHLVAMFPAMLSWEDDNKFSPFHILCETPARKIDMQQGQQQGQRRQRQQQQAEAEEQEQEEDGRRDLRELLERLIRTPEDVLRFDERGRLPLHLLCRNRTVQPSCLRALIGKSPSACAVPDSRGLTPLHHMCTNPALDRALVELVLVTHKGSAKLSSFEGDLPIHLLASNASATEECFQLLLDAFPESVLSINRKGQTILHQICSNTLCTKIGVVDLVVFYILKVQENFGVATTYRKTLPCPLLSILEQAQTLKEFVDKQQRETEIRKVAANRRKSSIANLRRSSGVSAASSPASSAPAEQTLDDKACEKMLEAVEQKLSRSSAEGEDLHRAIAFYFHKTFDQDAAQTTAAVRRVHQLCLQRGDKYISTWKLLHIDLHLDLQRRSDDQHDTSPELLLLLLLHFFLRFRDRMPPYLYMKMIHLLLELKQPLELVLHLCNVVLRTSIPTSPIVVQDGRKRTPLHVLCSSPHASAENVRRVLTPEIARLKDSTARIPIDIYCNGPAPLSSAVVDMLVVAYPEALNKVAQELSTDRLPLSYFLVSSKEVPDMQGQWSRDETADSRIASQCLGGAGSGKPTRPPRRGDARPERIYPGW